MTPSYYTIIGSSCAPHVRIDHGVLNDLRSYREDLRENTLGALRWVLKANYIGVTRSFRSNNYDVFDTFEEARGRWEQNLVNEIESLKRDLEEVRSMTKPDIDTVGFEPSRKW
jgi:hypothetical protein